MHPHGMSTSFHGKEDVSVLAGPHLHTGTGFTILCKVCGGKMLMAKEHLGKAKQVELHSRMEISISMDISVLGFYGYIKDISVVHFT